MDLSIEHGLVQVAGNQPEWVICLIWYLDNPSRIKYMFVKANWDQIKTDINMKTKAICNHIHEMPIDKIKNDKGKHSVPWLNRKLRKMLKRKARLHKHARQTGIYKEYKQFQNDANLEKQNGII